MCRVKCFHFFLQNYAYTLAKQLEKPKATEAREFGKAFGEKDLKFLTEDQTLQLVELFKETHPGIMKEEPGTAVSSNSGDGAVAAGTVPPVNDLSAAETNKTELKDNRQNVTNQEKP